MSTRKLNLFVTAAALALAGGVTAAGASLAAPPPAADGTAPPAGQPTETSTDMPSLPDAPTPPTSVSLPSPSAPVRDEAAADDPRECRDAECVIALKDDQVILIDKKYGVESIRVTVEGDNVTFAVRAKTSKSVATVDASVPYSSAYINGVKLRPYKTASGRLMLEISRA